MHEIGVSRSRVIVIDNFLEDARQVIEAAAALAPFPPEGDTAYPGRRRQISPDDAACAYVMKALQPLVPVINRCFGAPSFSVVEASFSMVTTRPEALQAVQRVPHFDCDDQSVLAVLHHLHDIPATGTSFYRHKATGIERVGPATAAAMREALRAEGTRPARAETGFVGETDEVFEKIFSVEGRFNRLAIYQGCLLHSGIITPGFDYSSDPRTGRLTGNLFVRMNGAVQ